MDEGGRFTDDGYIRNTGDGWTRMFDGSLDDIPDEYRLTGDGEEPMKDGNILAVVVEPGKKPEIKEIDSSLEGLQALVGGYIQAVYPYEDPVGIVCNEEAKLEGLPLNRALRDADGEIYDIVAGTFAIVGLTDDSFGSLDSELALKYAKLFEQPEQFAKLGDRIVAIPMISEEQQKQEAKEQKDFEVSMDTSGLAVSGHVGTWHTIDHMEVDGHTFFLMEHDTYGDEAACLIVDEHGKLSLSDVYDGFDEHTVDLLHQEVMTVDRMPDPSITTDEMKDYGYRLVKGDDKSKGKLETVPEEKAVVQLVFDMFLNRNMGYTAISGYLNRNGYTRPPAKNAIRPSYGEWSSDHIKRMLSNPVYTGRVAWGKRRTEKVPGSDNEYRLVKQDEYILSEVISHEEFVSKEDFDRVQEIKAIRGKKGNHNIGQYNAHLLSGIVKCPQCGAPMYIGMTKWTNQDGTERRTESYVCSYATKHRGTSVCRRNGVVASQVEDEVMEYTRKIVRNPQFIKDLQEKVMTAVDMTEVENDITAYKNQLSALQRSRDSLERDIDRIAPDDKYAERRRADMTRRLNDLYDQIYKAEDLLQESTMKKATLESEQMSVQSMIGILSSFDAIYDRMNAAERRDLVKYLISEVELFPREEQKTQKRFVKAIAYKFPIEQKVLTQFDECGASVGTAALLARESEWEVRL